VTKKLVGELLGNGFVNGGQTTFTFNLVGNPTLGLAYRIFIDGTYMGTGTNGSFGPQRCEASRELTSNALVRHVTGMATHPHG
jgi:hypothetical protein